MVLPADEGAPIEREPVDPAVDSRIVQRDLDVREDKIIALVRDISDFPEHYRGQIITMGTKKVRIHIGPRNNRLDDDAIQLTVTWKDL